MSTEYVSGNSTKVFNSKIFFLKNDINEIEQFCKDNMLVDYLKDVLYDYSGLSNVMELNDLVL